MGKKKKKIKIFEKKKCFSTKTFFFLIKDRSQIVSNCTSTQLKTFAFWGSEKKICLKSKTKILDPKNHLPPPPNWGGRGINLTLPFWRILTTTDRKKMQITCNWLSSHINFFTPTDNWSLRRNVAITTNFEIVFCVPIFCIDAIRTITLIIEEKLLTPPANWSNRSSLVISTNFEIVFCTAGVLGEDSPRSIILSFIPKLLTPPAN